METSRKTGRMAPSRTLLLLTIVAAAIPARADDEVAVPGRVVDLEANRPIAGAEVVSTLPGIPGSDAKPVEQRATTGPDGAFTLRFRTDREGAAPREFVLRVRHRGYVARTSSAAA